MPNLPITQSQHNGIKIKYERGKSAQWQRLYNYRWEKYSKSRLKRYPLCMQCLREGRTTAAKVTDHTVPHKGSRHKFWDKGNHASLCITCHNKKTAKEGAFGR